MKRLTIDLDDDTHQALKVASVQAGVTMVDVVRTLVADLLAADRESADAVYDRARSQ